MAREPLFAQYYDSIDAADVDLCFVDPEGTVLARMPSHLMVVKAASERWAAEVDRWQHQGPSVGSTGRMPFRVTISLQGPDELPLGKALVKTLYYERLDDELLSVGRGGSRQAAAEGRLVRLLELAHFATMQRVIGLICVRLAEVSQKGGLAWNTVERLLVAPEDLISSGDFVPLRHSVRTAVLAKLGDLEVTLNHPGMTAMLQRLPLASLTGLLSSDRLRVASECSVVAAINAWIRGCGGKDHVSQEECEQLLRCVRVNQLPQIYALTALPRQSWVIKARADGVVKEVVGLMGLPEDMAALRDMQLIMYKSLQHWRKYWVERGPRCPSVIDQLAAATPSVGEEWLCTMYMAAQRQLLQDWGFGGQQQVAPAVGGKRAGGAGAKPRKRHKSRTGGAAEGEEGEEQAAATQDGGEQQQQVGGVVRAEELEAVGTTFWAGFHWQAGLRWVPVSDKPIRGALPPMRLQLTLTASHAWSSCDVGLLMRDVQPAVATYKQGDQAGLKAARRGLKKGGKVQVLVAAGESMQGAAAGGAAAAVAAAKARLLLSPVAAAASSTDGSGSSVHMLVFPTVVPVEVDAWVMDWENVEGMPLALKPYMAGGAMRLSLTAKSVI